MRLHILGICGTFMSGVALLAKQSGHDVSGSDMNVYPPMSHQLAEQGISLLEGYEASHISADVDCVIVGNVIRRGNEAMEYVLAKNIPYTSGPAWLAENILKTRWVLGVAGTHGKTTTTSLLTWLLEQAGLQPGFLIGGVPENFGISARMGEKPYFVIEADEYDSAFFDKRSKFIHYHPRTTILNNLEYDHADIFPDLEAIQQQFHYLVRTLPGNGLILRHAQDANLQAVLDKGCWTPVVNFGEQGAWQAKLLKEDGTAFIVLQDAKVLGEVHWNLLGQHNVNNALAASAAAHHAGVPMTTAIEALSTFKNVKRRLEIKGKEADIIVYDDFAHHPTAIATTLAGLRANIGHEARMIAVIEFGSYTMRAGVHKDQIQSSLHHADMVVCKSTTLDWGLENILADFKQPTAIYQDVNTLVQSLAAQLKAGDHVVIMSNSAFDGVHHKLLAAIKKRQHHGA
ncbi:MAG: UDP-N-acetylmuramate:L-alanyl-gamma-D-glutamyl-meso-diaminopimelate ligase [Gammaproteobacteria bacterium]|nr:UDP-N-acetylmuramate:L-alanyl-gamma-D-glutamyl-meso-diaminopimelate ligase [Gammaproteobacteria bacterium]